MIRLAVKKMRAYGHLLERALSVWHGKDAEFCYHWVNFCTTINKQYVEMLARRGNSTLADDGYRSYNAITNEETTALSQNLIKYDERSARANARVGKMEERINTMATKP